MIIYREICLENLSQHKHLGSVVELCDAFHLSIFTDQMLFNSLNDLLLLLLLLLLTIALIQFQIVVHE